MNLKKVSLVLLIILLTPLVVYAQSAKDVYKSLKKLEAQMQVGVSANDFSQTLADAKLEVNMFMDSNQAKSKKKLTSAIKAVMGEYEDASFIFRQSLSGPYRYLKEAEYEDFRKMLSRYEEANKSIEDGGALERDVSDKGKPMDQLTYGPILNLNKFLPLILKRASNDLKEVAKLLPSTK